MKIWYMKHISYEAKDQEYNIPFPEFIVAVTHEVTQLVNIACVTPPLENYSW